jgi:hypothetical protein
MRYNNSSDTLEHDSLLAPLRAIFRPMVTVATALSLLHSNPR